MSNFSDNFNVIFTYTRAQAIEDGVLIDVSEMASEAGFTISVAITDRVWENYVFGTEEDNRTQWYQDIEGRLWDILWMLSRSIKKLSKANDIIFYKLYVVPRDGKSRKPRLTQLKAMIHGGDQGEPVITIMLPNED